MRILLIARIGRLKFRKARTWSDLEKTREARDLISIIETINSQKKETASAAGRRLFNV